MATACVVARRTMYCPGDSFLYFAKNAQQYVGYIYPHICVQEPKGDQKYHPACIGKKVLAKRTNVLLLHTSLPSIRFFPIMAISIYFQYINTP